MHSISLKYSRIGHKPEVFWLGFTHFNLAHTYTMLNLPMICFAPKLTPLSLLYTSSHVKAGKLSTESIIKTNWISLNSKAKDGFNSFPCIISPLFSLHKGSLYPTTLTHAGPCTCQPPTLGFDPETLPAHCKNHCHRQNSCSGLQDTKYPYRWCPCDQAKEDAKIQWLVFCWAFFGWLGCLFGDHHLALCYHATQGVCSKGGESICPE